MRRICIGFAIVLAVAGASLSAAPSVLSYSTNPFYPPYDWGLGDDRFDGASIELLDLVLPPFTTSRPVRVPWKRALAMAADGEIDLLLSLRITAERSEYLEFTTHRAFPNPIAVFVRSNSSITVDDWAKLKPYLGGVSRGDTFGGGFDEYWRTRLNVETAPSMLENFEKLRLGRIDYFVSGYYMGQSYLALTGLSGTIVALRPFVSNQDIHFAFSKKTPWKRLLPAMSAALAELDSKGALEAILKKHLARFSEKDAPKLFE
ncbi:MAG: transporter substrate-binding domain-containing protein [Treponemataceae bacterium]